MGLSGRWSSDLGSRGFDSRACASVARHLGCALVLLGGCSPPAPRADHSRSNRDCLRSPGGTRWTPVAGALLCADRRTHHGNRDLAASRSGDVRDLREGPRDPRLGRERSQVDLSARWVAFALEREQSRLPVLRTKHRRAQVLRVAVHSSGRVVLPARRAFSGSCCVTCLGLFGG